jgi:putative phage-type endonuclease
MHNVKVYDDIEQRSDEWHSLRLGCISASISSRIITSTGERATGFQDVVNQMVAENLTSKPANEIFINDAMQHGIDTEAEAINFFEFANDVTVQQVGFCKIDLPDVNIGCSPDGIIKQNKHLLEIKCPQPKKQIKVLRDGKLPTEYKSQVQMQLYVCNAEKLEFLSYHPSTKFFTTTISRDEPFISRLSNLLMEANDLINELTLKLRSK